MKIPEPLYGEPDRLGLPYPLEQYKGYARRYPWTAYDEVPPFYPPHTWQDMAKAFDFSLGGPERIKFLTEHPNVPTEQQLLFTKDHVRKHRTMNPLGYICWVQFTWREPAWVVVDDWEGTTIVPNGEYESRGVTTT